MVKICTADHYAVVSQGFVSLLTDWYYLVEAWASDYLLD
jgi:hypothetical protein